jgi:hypothetical protein
MSTYISTASYIDYCAAQENSLLIKELSVSLGAGLTVLVMRYFRCSPKSINMENARYCQNDQAKKYNHYRHQHCFIATAILLGLNYLRYSLSCRRKYWFIDRLYQPGMA